MPRTLAPHHLKAISKKAIIVYKVGGRATGNRIKGRSGGWHPHYKEGATMVQVNLREHKISMGHGSGPTPGAKGM